MIGMPHGARIWLACGATDMRRGFDGLAAMVQTQLATDPYTGHLFVFRGRRGNRLKILWYSGDGMNLLSKCRHPWLMTFCAFIDVICTFKGVTSGFKALPIVRAVGCWPCSSLVRQPGPAVVWSITEELVLR